MLFRSESKKKAAKWFTHTIWPQRTQLAGQLRQIGLSHFDIAQTVQNYADCIHYGAVATVRHARQPYQNGVRPVADSKLNPMHR